MPRKKLSEVSGPGAAGSPARIHCPACKSEISADGSTLHSRSKDLEEWIETSGDVAKMEKLVEEFEKKLAAKDAECQKLKAELAAKTKPEGQANVGKQEQQQRKQRGSWW